MTEPKHVHKKTAHADSGGSESSSATKMVTDATKSAVSESEANLETAVETSKEDSANTTSELSEQEIAELQQIPENIPKISDETIEKLSSAVMTQLHPDFQESKKLLSEVCENQRILIETLQQENAKFKECQALKEVVYTMEKAKLYHTKLQNIKKEMSSLHEKSAKLKKRALKLQQQKQKEALQRELERERELQKEKMLIAKPAKQPP